ncbi:MAG TPA: MerR family DNA-binding transcriptional regulator [Ktedonosporobacter sp.]|nr:MerR family DNA-binding transcriptional regulator [Ktedonosporobacter sp.]
MMQTLRSFEMRSRGQFESLTISQVSRMTGVNAKAIRYYESIGLLPRPARFANSYRRYNMVDVNRLILLRSIRDLGVPLTQARQLLIGSSDARCLDVQQELIRLVNARLLALDQEIAELHQLRDEIASYQHELADCHPDERASFRTCIDMSCLALAKETPGKENTDDGL